MNAGPHTYPTVCRKEKFMDHCMDSIDQIVKLLSVMAVHLIASLLQLLVYMSVNKAVYFEDIDFVDFLFTFTFLL
jgi:hypothetical protein